MSRGRGVNVTDLGLFNGEQIFWGALGGKPRLDCRIRNGQRICE